MEVEQQPQPRSLADALARNQQTWNGKTPEDPAPETPEPESPEPPAPEATETTPSPPETPEPPKFKHQTWEETERARLEAEKRMHEATAEAARYRDDLERLQREREARPPEPTPAPATSPASTSVKQLEDGLKQMNAIQREYEIDGNEEALFARSAQVWRESFSADPQLREIFEAQARQVVKQQFEQEWTTRQAQVKVEQDQRTEQEKLVALAADRAQQSGLDIVGDREAQRLFWGYAAEEVDALFPEAPYEQRIDEAIKIVSRLKPPQPTAAAPPAEEAPTTEPPRRPPQPMGRQSGAPVGVPTGEAENSDRRPLTLEEALQKTHRAQRL